jgi:hypothetical protein
MPGYQIKGVQCKQLMQIANLKLILRIIKKNGFFTFDSMEAFASGNSSLRMCRRREILKRKSTLLREIISGSGLPTCNPEPGTLNPEPYGLTILV